MPEAVDWLNLVTFQANVNQLCYHKENKGRLLHLFHSEKQLS